MLFHRDETVRARRHGVNPAAHKELGQFGRSLGAHRLAASVTARQTNRAGYGRKFKPATLRLMTARRSLTTPITTPMRSMVATTLPSRARSQFMCVGAMK